MLLKWEGGARKKVYIKYGRHFQIEENSEVWVCITVLEIKAIGQITNSPGDTLIDVHLEELYANEQGTISALFTTSPCSFR